MQEFALHAAVTELFSIIGMEKENPNDMTDYLLGKSKMKLDSLKEKLNGLTENQTARLCIFKEKHKVNRKIEPLLNLIVSASDEYVDSVVVDGTTLASSTPNITRSQSMIKGAWTPRMKTSKSFNLLPKTPGLTFLDLSGTPKTPAMAQREQKKEKEQYAFRSLENVSLENQEAWVIEDLLYVLMGMDGELMCLVPCVKLNGIESFDTCIEKNLDTSLREFVLKILGVAVSYRMTTEYLEKHSVFRAGMISHALCAGIRELLNEYLVLVSQLEHQAHTDGTFSLQKMWYYLESSRSTLDAVSNLLLSLIQAESQDVSADAFLKTKRGFSGGKILNIISQNIQIYKGDPVRTKVYSVLLEKTMIPFFDMLRKWIFSGQISDHYNEFMISESQNIAKESLLKGLNDIYWEQRFALHDEYVPVFLESAKERILLTGKYLNVLKECKAPIPDKEAIIDFYESKKSKEMILNGKAKVAFFYANQTLLELLFKNKNVLSQLRTIKMYFLMEQSDFLTQFFDVALVDMIQPVEKVPKEKLQVLLDLVLRSHCGAGSESIIESIKVGLDSTSLFEKLLKINSVAGVDIKRYMSEIRSGNIAIEPLLSRNPTKSLTETDSMPMSGIDAFSLEFQVQFPMSLILNKKILTKYQLIFRHLFHCKYIERLLMGTWLDHAKLRKSFKGGIKSENTSYSPWQDEVAFIGRLGSLSGKMLHFIQQFMYYMFVEVIEPNWRKMEKNMMNALTIDQVINGHDDFLNTCLKECMLTNPKLIKSFNKIMSEMKSVVEFSEWYCRSKGLDSSTESQKNQDLGAGIPVSLAHYSHPSQSVASTSNILHFSGLRNTPASATPALINYEKEFGRQVNGLIDLLLVIGNSESSSLCHLCNMMDYNRYYSCSAPNVGFVSSPLVAKRFNDVLSHGSTLGKSGLSNSPLSASELSN